MTGSAIVLASWAGKVMMVMILCTGSVCSKTSSITTPERCRDTQDTFSGTSTEVYCLNIPARN